MSFLTRLLFAAALACSLGATASAVEPRAGEGAAAPAQAPPAAEPSDDDEEQGDSRSPAWPSHVGSPEQVLYAQQQRMREALARLSPRVPGKTNLYLIAFAGDAEESVFRNEVEYVERLFDERFGAAGHVLTLINHPGTLDHRPIASLSNLEIAVDALGRKLHPTEDVLMVFITTHGSPDHELYVSLDPLPLDQIAPDDLADLFAASPIRHRVFVISACYSGGFIDALKGKDTMVITAARGDRASFGCGAKSAITDFGRAFFVDALNRTASFTEAFDAASVEIDAWETRDHQKHSLPQIASDSGIEAKLAAWRRGIKPGPAVPFAAAPRMEGGAAVVPACDFFPPCLAPTTDRLATSSVP